MLKSLNVSVTEDGLTADTSLTINILLWNSAPLLTLHLHELPLYQRRK